MYIFPVYLGMLILSVETWSNDVSLCEFIILCGLCIENNPSELKEDCPICFKMSHFLSIASH